MATTKGLGRGLSALLGEPRPKEETSAEVKQAANEAGPVKPSNKVPVEFLKPSPLQPRRNFHEEEIKELAASLKEKGMLQPVLVRPAKGKDTFEIVAGERRWRAAQKAGLHEVPVIVRELSDAEVLQVAIIENVQRTDLSPVEEARGYRRLIDEFGNKQDDVAKLVGKSRSHVANIIRLLSLPKDVIQLIDEGKLTMGHARALITTSDPSALAKQIVDEGLNVREAEAAASSAKPKTGISKKVPKDADTLALEKSLSDALGLSVSLNYKGKRGGTVVIRYKTLDQLDALCGRLVK